MQSGSDISQLTTVYYIYKIVHPCSINVVFMLLYIYLKLCEALNNLETFFKNFIWWLEFLLLFFLSTLITNQFSLQRADILLKYMLLSHLVLFPPSISKNFNSFIH